MEDIRKYELIYYIFSDFTEMELKDSLNRIMAIIEEEGGEIEKQKEPRKIKLAYPVKKKREAYLAECFFSLLPEKINNLKKKLKKEEAIGRFMILKKEEKEKDVSRSFFQSIKKSTVKSEEDFKKEKTTEKIKPQKVELDELNQKIEEILKE